MLRRNRLVERKKSHDERGVTAWAMGLGLGENPVYITASVGVSPQGIISLVDLKERVFVLATSL